MKFTRDNQKELRADLYKGLVDFVKERQLDIVDNFGRMVILPSSFKGGERDMTQKYQDAMSIVRKKGKPDLFITFTCNPKWKEITRELLRESNTRSTSVFNIKLKRMIKDIKVNHIFGIPITHIHVIEFQVYNFQIIGSNIIT